MCREFWKIILCCSTRSRCPSCTGLFMISQISNLERLELYLCVLGRDTQGTEGSGNCANPQDTVASFKGLKRMAATPCWCWQPSTYLQMGKICIFPSLLPNPSYQGHSLFLQVPSSWPYAYMLGLSKVWYTRKDHYSQWGGLYVINFC